VGLRQGLLHHERAEGPGRDRLLEEGGRRGQARRRRHRLRERLRHRDGGVVDDAPLASATKILVQVGTREHSTGWATKPVQIKVDKEQVPGEQITSFGGLPWQIEDASIVLTVRNAKVTKATALDCNGMATAEVPVEKVAGGVKVAFPKDALYLVLH
jgi:hypothetical protein